MTSTQTLNFEAPDQGEESARAELYGVLASLFYAPPAQSLLDAIAASPAEGDGVLQRAWTALSVSCKLHQADSTRDEYEALFIGVGKPDILLYGSYYLSGFLMEKPLAALRTDLAMLGLERDEAMPESEDHIAALCEVMRCLITSDDIALANIGTQKSFFGTHMQPWVSGMCDTIAAHPGAHFYAPVARLAKVFFEVEAQAFDMV